MVTVQELRKESTKHNIKGRSKMNKAQLCKALADVGVKFNDCVKGSKKTINGSPRKRKAKKSPAKKSPVKKSPAKKSPAKKSPAKKSPAKKSPAKKAPEDWMKSREYSVYRGTGYFMEGKYVTEESIDMILKVDEDKEDFFIDMGDEDEQPENHRVAYFTKIKEEGVDYVDAVGDADYINEMRGRSRVLKKKKWVKPKGLPRKLVNYMEKHATYGEIEFHHFTV